MKRTMFMLGGVCWFVFALGFGVFLVQYIVGGAGLPFFGFSISIDSVLLGMLNVMGLLAIIGLCFAMGMGMWVRGGEKETQSD